MTGITGHKPLFDIESKELDTSVNFLTSCSIEQNNNYIQSRPINLTIDPQRVQNDESRHSNSMNIVVTEYKLFLYYHNMGGMRTALPRFRQDITSCPYDVVLISESWLQGQHLDEEVVPLTWRLFRSDRILPPGITDEVGGGVLLAIKTSLSPELVEIDLPIGRVFDIKICKIKTDNFFTCFCVFYIPPDPNVATNEQLTELAHAIVTAYNLLSSDDVFFAIGDSNTRGIEWDESEFHENIFDATNIPERFDSFITILASAGLFQYNNIKNVAGNVLDTVWSNMNYDIELKTANLTLTEKSSPYHTPLSIVYRYDSNSVNRPKALEKTISYDFNKSNYLKINEEINALHFDDMQLTVDQHADLIYSVLFDIIDKYTPKRTRIALSCPPHMDKALRILRNKRNKAWKKWNDSKLPEDETFFLNLSQQFHESETEAVILHKQKIAYKVIDEPKLFWNYISERRRDTSLPTTMKYGDLQSSDAKEIANMFKKFFSTVYQVPQTYEPKNFDHIISSPEILDTITISEEIVKQKLKSIDLKKGAGPDLINAKFLFETKETVARILCNLFNHSMRDGVFPKIWKNAFVIPIFKSGDKSSIENYRGIFIMSTATKIFEDCVFDILKPFFEPIIHRSQHGFMVGRSTLSNLATHTSFIRKELAEGNQVDSIYTDFSKAFDKVDHGILTYKLEKYGIRGSLLTWFKSFLSERTQTVKSETAQSDPFILTSGVPQGGVLAPLLFKVHINDFFFLVDELNCVLGTEINSSGFADDYKGSAVIKSTDDTLVLQKLIELLVEWVKNNAMCLNIKKCIVITFSRKNDVIDGNYYMDKTRLTRANTVRDLGVILDSKLTFKHQIDKVVSTGRSVLGFVKRRAKDFNNPYLTKLLYTTLVLPAIEYAGIIWAPYNVTDMSRVESIQKQFLLFALRHLGFTGYRLPQYESRLLLINMIPIGKRFTLSSALFAFDLLRSNIKVSELCNRIHLNNHTHSTRGRRYLVEDQHLTNFSYNDVVSAAIRNFNTYSKFYEPTISKETFKKRILDDMKKLF